MRPQQISLSAGRGLTVLLVALGCAACGAKSGSPTVSASRAASHAASGSSSKAKGAHGGQAAPVRSAATTMPAVSPSQGTTTTAALPGAGHPPIELGDKNFTEQFILGQLYAQALEAQGYTVTVNQNIGPTSVTMQALKNGALMAYPEYLTTFDSTIAGYRHGFKSRSAAYAAATRWAVRHGLVLLAPTPFSDTDGIAVTDAYAAANRLRAIFDLRRVATEMTVGGPPQFEKDPPGLAQVTDTYGVSPAAFKPIAIGDQYAALNSGRIQAADVKTTDGQLASGDYVVLRDPAHVFGFGNVVPVVSAKALAIEGPVFIDTILRVDAELTTRVMRELNQLVDVAHQSPATVARQFLETHGLLTPAP